MHLQFYCETLLGLATLHDRRVFFCGGVGLSTFHPLSYNELTASRVFPACHFLGAIEKNLASNDYDTAAYALLLQGYFQRVWFVPRVMVTRSSDQLVLLHMTTLPALPVGLQSGRGSVGLL